MTAMTGGQAIDDPGRFNISGPGLLLLPAPYHQYIHRHGEEPESRTEIPAMYLQELFRHESPAILS